MDDMEWIRLIQQLGPKLYRFFLSRDSKTQAEESVQEVFTRLLERLNRSECKNELVSAEAYAWGIALNLRKEHNRTLLSAESLLGQVHPDEIADPIVGLDQNLSSDLSALKRAVAELEEPERTILQLVLSGMQISEICSVLGIPEGTVKSHIHRAKDNIRDKMKKWRLL